MAPNQPTHAGAPTAQSDVAANVVSLADYRATKAEPEYDEYPEVYPPGYTDGFFAEDEAADA
jgi:hypothetical protein